MCKQISSNSFKNEITYKLFPYKSYMYIHLNVSKQMTDVKLLLFQSNSWNYLTVWKEMINSKLIWFGLVCFYGISTNVGYLIPNPAYTFIY